MENIQLLLGGFSTLFTFSNVGAAMMGAVLGLIVGAMPGIGSLAGVALLLPLTFPLRSSLHHAPRYLWHIIPVLPLM